jgi:hypothetical protein
VNLETSGECNGDKVNHYLTLQEIFQVLHFNEKIPKWILETSRECNSDKVNYEITLKKYSNSYTSMKKNSKMNFEVSTECSRDSTLLRKYSMCYILTKK